MIHNYIICSFTRTGLPTVCALIRGHGFYFMRPWWLTAFALIIPVVWLGRRHLTALSPVRRTLAIILRTVVISILVLLLSRLMLTRKSDELTLITVIDRSQSVPENLHDAALAYLREALGDSGATDRLGVVDVAEAASISKLSSSEMVIRQRNTTLFGQQSKLSDGIQMAIAIAPPDSATRILLVSDGNETAGDLKESARIAAISGIPIDVLPLRYDYEQEVIFRRLAAPAKARSGQTISLRFILSSTDRCTGRLLLNLNGKPVDLVPETDEIAAPIELEAGTNVKTISLPVGTRGMHNFEGIFIPDDATQDRLAQNNHAATMTFVAGPGHVLVVDSDDSSANSLYRALGTTDIDVRYRRAVELPDNLAMLMDIDVIVLANTDCSSFTYQQQEMLKRYVTDLGGGLIMTGGPDSFGAGGWIGSPIAEILPVDLDPPQKKQMPKGALVLIMHACEIPQGNYWGKKIAEAAAKTLSRKDLVGILAYAWQGGSDWVYPLSEAGDKSGVISAIKQMQMGDMPDMGRHLQAAYDKLVTCDAGQKHVIIISDGDPQGPTDQLLSKMKDAKITCTGVAINPHSPADVDSLRRIAQLTNGRFYNVQNPSQLPRIFVKEAQVVRRNLIVEETFTPKISYGLSEIVRGLSTALPNLDGYVLTGAKSDLSQVIIKNPKDDPIMAVCQAGLGRCVAFTSSVDSQWAGAWIQWGGFERFWEQTARWAAKPGESYDCEVFADVDGREVTINVEAVDVGGKSAQLAHIEAQMIAPDVSMSTVTLAQTGPGQFQGKFQASSAGSHVLNLRYRKVGDDAKTHVMQVPVTVPFAPEYRDLSDNTPLLEEVSSITSGRVLTSDAAGANLFDRSGVKFPQTQLPLTRPLMFAWLLFFLLDVAVRRIAIDFKAIGRALSGGRKRRGPEQREQMLNQLRLRRKKVQEKFKSRSKRYEAVDAEARDLPVAKAPRKMPAAGAKPTEKPAQPKKPPTQEQSHIQQLLRAKRKAAEEREDKDSQKNE